MPEPTQVEVPGQKLAEVTAQTPAEVPAAEVPAVCV
jgi:hypothetical protein